MYTKSELKRISKDRLIEMYLDQQRQLERMSDIAGAMAGDGGIAERYQRERDALRDWQNGAYAFFAIVRDAIKTNLERAEEHHNLVARTVGASDAHRRYLPVLVEIAESAGEQSLKNAEIFVDKLNRPNDALRQIVRDILIYAKLDALYSTIDAQRWEAWARAGDPVELALSIYTVWDVTGNIDEALIIRLCDGWKDAPQPAKLIEALREVSAYNRRPEGQGQDAYCDLRGIAKRTFQEHLRRVNDLRELAQTATQRKSELAASAGLALDDPE